MDWRERIQNALQNERNSRVGFGWEQRVEEQGRVSTVESNATACSTRKQATLWACQKHKDKFDFNWEQERHHRVAEPERIQSRQGCSWCLGLNQSQASTMMGLSERSTGTLQHHRPVPQLALSPPTPMAILGTMHLSVAPNTQPNNTLTHSLLSCPIPGYSKSTRMKISPSSILLLHYPLINKHSRRTLPNIPQYFAQNNTESTCANLSFKAYHQQKLVHV